MSAKVTEIAAVRTFKEALIEFRDEAAAALEAMRMQIHRTIDWVDYERPAYWSKQVQLGFEKVAQARTRLTACQMRTVAGRRASCIEEQQELERARRRLAYCQEMVPRVKQWSMKLAEEADEFRGRTAGFTRCVESDLPRMIALIERTAAALERYAELAGAPGSAVARTTHVDAASSPNTSTVKDQSEPSASPTRPYEI